MRKWQCNLWIPLCLNLQQYNRWLRPLKHKTEIHNINIYSLNQCFGNTLICVSVYVKCAFDLPKWKNQTYISCSIFAILYIESTCSVYLNTKGISTSSFVMHQNIILTKLYRSNPKPNCSYGPGCLNK